MNKYQPEPRIRKLKSILKGGDHKKSWQCKLQLQNEFTLSLIFVLFSVSLSLSAVSFANMSQKNLHAEIGKYYSDKAGEHLWYIYSIVYILIAQDTFILLAMVIGVLCSIGFCFFLDLTETSSVEQSVKNLEALANTLRITLDAKPTLRTEAEHLVVATGNLREELKHVVRPVRRESDRALETVISFKGGRIDKAIEKLDSILRTLEKIKNLTDSIRRGTYLSTLQLEQKNDLLTKLENLEEGRQQQIDSMKKAKEALNKISDSNSQHLSTDFTNLIDVITQGYLSDWCEVIVADLTALESCGDAQLHSSVQRIITKVADFSAAQADIIHSLKAMSAATTVIWMHVHHMHFENILGNNLYSARLCLSAAELSLVTLISSTDVEILSLSSLNTLLEVESCLTAAIDTLPVSSNLEFRRVEKLNCSLNLIKAATSLTTVAIDLATHSTDLDRDVPMWKRMASSLIVAATKLTTSISYVIDNDVKDDLTYLQRAASELARTVCKAEREASLPEIAMPRGKLWMPLWEFCTYSTLFPLCSILNHLNYIIIAFINNLYHATGVAIGYGVIIVFYYVAVDRIPHILCLDQSRKQSRGWHLVLLQVLKVSFLVLLSGYIAVDIILYFFIPIENAFDDAANHFISVYQTTIVFFTAIFLYFIYQLPSRTAMTTFSRAADRLFYKHKSSSVLNIARGDWVRLGEDEKEIELAKGLLKKIN